jgi:hypothetical protein
MMIKGIQNGEYYLYYDFLSGIVVIGCKSFKNCLNIFIEILISPLISIAKYFAG